MLTQEAAELRAKIRQSFAPIVDNAVFALEAKQQTNVEQLHEGGNIHGFDSILLLACMQSTTDASWVLVSGTSCNDGSDKPTRCDGRIVRAVPRFIVDENFWQAKDTPNTSYPMLYNLLKFGVGENCRINSQQYEARGICNHSEVDKYWQCDKLSV